MKASVSLVLATATAAALFVGCAGESVESQRTRTGVSQSSASDQTARPTSNIEKTVEKIDSTKNLPVATLYVAPEGDKADPTEGDIVDNLANKVSCFQKTASTCILLQTNRTSFPGIEKVCKDNDSVLEAGNQCGDLDITAKCNVEIKGDRFTIYNIGALSKQKEDVLAKDCAGMKVGNAVFKGTFVSLTDQYAQNIGGLPGVILNVLDSIFRGIFGVLGAIFGFRV